jgi:glycosyltransferase involved in cell wall biosynthesis
MRVLRIIARLNVGGPARHVTVLDRGLRARGFETLLAHGEIGPHEASLEELVQASGIPSCRIPGLGRRVSAFGDLRALYSLVRLVFRFRPDVIHTHTAKAGTLGRAAALAYNLCRNRQTRCLVVHTFHGHVLHGYFGTLGSALVRSIERLLARVTDCVFVLSPRQREELSERFRIASADRLHIVPLGLELESLTRLAVDSRELPREVVFGYVGRFVPIKNLPLLIEAFAVVHQSVPQTRLLMVGDGESRNLIETLVARHGLESAVDISGWRNDLPDLYRSIDVLVLTSLNEGTPVAVIEAMAAALPVVATDVGGVSDLVRDVETGIVVPSGLIEPLASAMLRLARNPAERRRFGIAGRETVRIRFSAERLVSDVSNLYRCALDRKRSGRPMDRPIEARGAG